MEADYEGFSIREYTLHIRSVELQKCWPFSGEITEDLIQSLLPPITVTKFRWWSHELASLLTKSPVMPEPAFRRKGKSKSTPCKKRSITDEGEDSDVLTGSKRKKSKDLVVQKLKERSSGVRCLSYTEEELFPDWDSEFQIPVRRSFDHSNLDASHVRFSDQSGKLSPLDTKIISLELCCSEMNRLSLFSEEDQLPDSPVNDEITTVISNDDQTSDIMQLESRQLNKFQPAVSERRSSHTTPHFSLERIKEALDFERKRHVAQPASAESQYISCSSSLSQPASADMHYRTSLNQSSFDPLLLEGMQKPVLHRQRHVEEAISGFPLNSQGELVKPNGEGCLSFDRAGLGNGSSTYAAENDILHRNVVDLSGGKKHFTDPAPVHNEKRYKYFPARLGLDETFTEKAFFISDTNGVECGQTVDSSVSEVSHTINSEPKQNTLSQSLDRNMAANRDGLCLHNNQSTMRLMGKDVSVGTSYSDFVRRGERTIATDGSVDCSFLENHTHQSSWLWRMNTVGVSENHSTTSLDKSWNINLLCDTSKFPFPRTAVVPDSDFPPTILYPCGSLASSPLTDRDLSFHGSGLGQQLNSVAFSQQQLHLPSTPDVTYLPSGYSNVGIGHFPDARQPSLGFPFSFKDSTSQSQLHWPQSYFESSRSDMSFINPVGDQLASLYGSNSSPYTNVGEANKRLAYLEEYPMKSQRIPMFPMQGGLNHEKEFYCRPGN